MKAKRNSEKEQSQDIGNPYRRKPDLTDKGAGGDPFGFSANPRGWYGKKDAPMPDMPAGAPHYDGGGFTD